MIKCRSQTYFCSLQYVMETMSGKWKAPILWMLGENTLRFGELERKLPNTARKVLIEQLKELEVDEIVRRVVYAEVPPKVEYSLTERGLLLLPILRQLWRWGYDHITYINKRDAELAPEPSPEVTTKTS